MFTKTSLCNDVYRGISELSTYTAGANACIRFISDLFPHEWGLKPIREYSENPCDFLIFFSCLHSRGSYPICVTWEEKNRNWVTWTMQCKCSLSAPLTPCCLHLINGVVKASSKVKHLALGYSGNTLWVNRCGFWISQFASLDLRLLGSSTHQYLCKPWKHWQ